MEKSRARLRRRVHSPGPSVARAKAAWATSGRAGEQRAARAGLPFSPPIPPGHGASLRPRQRSRRTGGCLFLTLGSTGTCEGFPAGLLGVFNALKESETRCSSALTLSHPSSDAGWAPLFRRNRSRRRTGRRGGDRAEGGKKEMSAHGAHPEAAAVPAASLTASLPGTGRKGERPARPVGAPAAPWPQPRA